MKKTLVMMLALIMSFSVFLAACGGNDDDSSNSGNSGNDGDEPYEIIWYTIGTPQKDTDKVFEHLNEYLVDKINATVKMTQIDWGDYMKKMQIKINSGEKFDIAYIAGSEYLLNARKGAFLDMGELLDQYGQETKAILDPAFLEGPLVNGTLYGLPANKEIGQQSVYLFNKSLVEKYEMDIASINSLADLDPYLAAVQQNEPDFQPMATFKPYLPFDYILGDELPFAIRLDGDQTKIVNFYEEPETMEILKVMHDYYDKGYLVGDAGTSDDPWPLEVENWFVRKEMYQPTAELQWARSAGYDLVMQPMHQPITFNGSLMGSMQAISSTSENPQKAMEFLNLLNTDPYVRATVDKGIKGVHYEELEGGKIKDIMPARDNYRVPTYSLGNHFILPLYENDPENKWELFQEFNDDSIAAPTIGFYFDAENVKNEIAAIENVRGEFAKIILHGAVDPEEFIPMATKKFEDAGMNVVMEEMQAQYTAWLAEQE